MNASPALIAQSPNTLPVLYSFRRCPYAMRARLALASGGIACELREIVLKDKPASLLRASPKGTVPVLVLPSGQVIDQSLDIMLWALRRHDPEGWLRPVEGGLDDLLALIQACDQGFKADLDRYKYPNRFGVDPVLHRGRAMTWLNTLTQRLTAQTFLFGPRPALADFAMAPFVRQFAQTDVPWFEQHTNPALQQWLTRCLSLSLFKQIMHKYPVWADGSAGAAFPPKV